MTKSENISFPDINLSHFELYARDVASMENFYTRNLGFVVTDRGEGENGMVFLSGNPDEHHQLVLNPRQSHKPEESPVDHMAPHGLYIFEIQRQTDLNFLQIPPGM